MAFVMCSFGEHMAPLMATGLGRDKHGSSCLNRPEAVTTLSVMVRDELGEDGWVLQAKEATTTVSVMGSFALSTPAPGHGGMWPRRWLSGNPELFSGFKVGHCF